MTESPLDAAAELARLGGRHCHDRDGDFWEFTAGEFLVHIEPFSRSGRDNLMVGIDCAIEHSDLAVVVRQILGEPPKSFQTMLYQQYTSEVQASQQPAEAFRALVSSTLPAVRALCIADIISDFRATPPPPRSMGQILHLAALAWSGDYTTLEDYQRIFARGGHLKFVPTITKRMIDSALSIANQRFADSFDDPPSSQQPGVAS